MSVALKQNVISGESIKANSPESVVASRILTADPDQSPAACLIRELRKELEAANRKYSSREEEILELKKAISEKENVIKNLNYEHSLKLEKLEKQAFTIGRQLDEKNAEIERFTSNHKSVIEAKESEIAALKSSHARELEELRQAKDAAIADLKTLHKAELARICESKDAEIALVKSKAQGVLAEKYIEIQKLENAVSALEKKLEDYRETDIEALKNQLDSAMRGLLNRDGQLKNERVEAKKRDKAKDTEIAKLQRKSERDRAAKDGEIAELKQVHVSELKKLRIEKDVEIAELKRKTKEEGETISSLKSEKMRVLSEKAKEIAALEFELRRLQAKSRWKRIGCFVCGVFTLPVLFLLICVIL